ncbi:DUF5133 domain-containing protein [Streptomyces sp. SID13666]|uniref:DUF5133 domain-containing protein n=1 Tax=unclassified Streptomyces TaxID=2593676 RepID=UPI0013C02518|nr:MULTISPECIES: DUF5133 domain-containing protein [unclassified Streptomyces]NEA58718.1 DUF5133 domain-containing protein [Streptomyces sp. SID13666]NEA70141.1 DUF5133 domain-containing protein [Streptomyces sp. SID13588]
MLMAHPAVLRDLLERYEALAAQVRGDSAGSLDHRRLEDTAYTLCVITGVRTVGRAVEAARQRLAADSGPSSAPQAVAS